MTRCKYQYTFTIYEIDIGEEAQKDYSLYKIKRQIYIVYTKEVKEAKKGNKLTKAYAECYVNSRLGYNANKGKKKADVEEGRNNKYSSYLRLTTVVKDLIKRVVALEKAREQ